MIPDVDQALVDFLDTHPALVPLHGGRVGTKLAGGSLASVRITSIGGTQPWPWESSPEYQVEWWGGDESQAKQLAREGEAALWGFLDAVAFVTGVTMPISMLWSPDDVSGRPRVISQVQYRVHPEES